jgi:hypothetical protein
MCSPVSIRALGECIAILSPGFGQSELTSSIRWRQRSQTRARDEALWQARSLSGTVLALAVVVHTASMLIVAGVLAVLFFEFHERLATATGSNIGCLFSKLHLRDFFRDLSSEILLGDPSPDRLWSERFTPGWDNRLYVVCVVP